MSEPEFGTPEWLSNFRSRIKAQGPVCMIDAEDVTEADRVANELSRHYQWYSQGLGLYSKGHNRYTLYVVHENGYKMTFRSWTLEISQWKLPVKIHRAWLHQGKFGYFTELEFEVIEHEN
jgi:hypothetical protein